MFGTQHNNLEWLPDYHEEGTDPEITRWRNVILRLNERITEDLRQHSNLAPYLSEAFAHAVFQLLIGEKDDLLTLSDWLDEEAALREMRNAHHSARHHSGRHHVGHELTISTRSPSFDVAALAA